MKEIAKAYPRATIRNAVVPVSVYFNDPQHQTTKDVSLISRLNVMRTIHVSTTTAYGLGKKTSSYAKKNIFVFDPRGGIHGLKSLFNLEDKVDFPIVDNVSNTSCNTPHDKIKRFFAILSMDRR
ncbi:hypothetical protein JHK87_012559 [Glycine soja]|nr:hypothetical protein JHK87_012559 [Glycine soja]